MGIESLLAAYQSTATRNTVSNPILFGNTGQDTISFQQPFSFNPTNYLGYGDTDFMATMAIFEGFLSTPNFFPCFDEIFNNTYRTNTDLPSLKGVYNAELGNQLANIAEKNASKTNSVGWCFREVRESLEAAGLSKGEIRGASAYQAGDMLAKHKNFQEVNVSRDELKDLPAGCVIVWDKSFGHRHGHIGVTLGDGREASDHVQNIRPRNAGYRVFVPTGINKSG